jgi:PknH-like extracellular domain
VRLRILRTCTAVGSCLSPFRYGVVMQWWLGIGVCVVVAGCATTLDGTAEPADTLGPNPTTSTTAAPTLVPAAGINDKLLKRSELAGIVGDTDMRQFVTYVKPDDSVVLVVQPSECTYRLFVAGANAYGAGLGGHELVAMAGDGNRGARGQVAYQVISVWQDRVQPVRAVEDIGLDWGLCPDGVFTLNAPEGQAHWLTGTVISRAPAPRISTTSQRQEPPPHTCSHVVAAQANVLVETSVCGDGDTMSAANQIADSLLAKFPQ